MRSTDAQLKYRGSKLFLLAAVGWALCILGVSLFANHAKIAFGTGVSNFVLDGESVSPVLSLRHRLVHLLPFGSLTLLLLFINRRLKWRLLIILLVAALGLCIEYLQYWIFTGAFEWWDVRDDTLGAIAAFLIASWPAVYLRLFKRPA